MEKVYNSGVYSGDFAGDIPEGNGTFTFKNGDKYTGEFKQGKFCGKGVFYFKNGSVYEGDFDDNNFEGFGTAVLANGRKYTGEFHRGKRHGKGTLYYENGDVYEGDFEAGYPNGTGTAVYADGSRYEGGFKNGARDGSGIFYDSNGIGYEGVFSGDDIIGDACVSFDSGEKLVGDFKDLVFSARQCIFENGDVYEGEFTDNLPGGKGKITYADGSEYVGDVEYNMRNGQGVLKYPNGNIYEGGFTNNVREGEGTFTFTDGKKYVGEFSGGNYNGKGTFYYKSGNIYEGDFKDGQREGQGVMQYANGQKFVGEYRDDKICGHGYYYFSNGDVYDGEWENNQMNGSGKLLVAAGSEEHWDNGEYDLSERYEGTWKNGKKNGSFIHYRLNLAFDETYADGKKTVCPVQPQKSGVKEDPAGKAFTVRYGGQNAFFIETASAIFIFDWFLKELPYIREDKPIHVFISGKTPERLNPGIFSLAEMYKDISVYIGYDRTDKALNKLLGELPEAVEDSISCFSGEQRLTTDFGTVRSLEAGGSGVAFLIETDDMTLFHAGEMYWHGESDQTILLGGGATMTATDFLKNKRLKEEKFKTCADALKGLRIDYAMLPLDPRFGDFGEKTVRYFLETADIKIFTPMSLWGNYKYISFFAERNAKLVKKMISVNPGDDKILCSMRFGKAVSIDFGKKLIRSLDH